MHAAAQVPMRTEDDVRTALMALEDQAPSAETVLRVVHAAGTRRARRPARARQSPRWPHLVMGIATAAALAALAIAVLPGGAPSGSRGRRMGPGPGTVGVLPSAATLSKAMLTASSAATGDILYTTQTGVDRGVVMDVYQDWIWPANPVSGQQARWRGVFTLRVSRTKQLLLTEEDQFTYTVPPGSPDSARANYARGHLVVVCYAGTGQNGCGYGNTETPTGSWSQHTGRFVNPGAGTGDLSPAGLAKAIARGQWRVTGRTHVNGQPAIELTETRRGTYQPPPVLLWVNAHTHLPIRMIGGAGGAAASTFDWYYLKPTAANMALLRAGIPHGYSEVR